MTQVGESTLDNKTQCTTCEAQANGQSQGDPIDVATGRAYTTVLDVEFPRPFRLDLYRTWLSTNKDRPGLFGLGWSTLFDTRITLYPDTIVWEDDEYTEVEFPPLAPGETKFLTYRNFNLAREQESPDQEPLELTDNFGRIFHYALKPGSPAGQLQWISRNGIDLIYLSWDHDRLASITDAAGHAYTLESDASNRITSITSAAHGSPLCIRGFTYDTQGRLVSVRDEENAVFRYEYNDANLMTRKTDRNGYAFHYEYDADNRCTKNYGDGGRYLHTFEYLPLSNKTIVTYPNGHKKQFYCKFTGLCEMTEDALGQTAQRIHNPDGLLTGEILKDKTTIIYEVDTRGREVERQDQACRVWKTGYTDNGILERDPLDNDILSTYDADNNLIRRSDHLGNYQEFHYDEKNRRIPRRGNDRYREFDPWRRLTLEQDALGNRTTFTYDTKGRLTSRTNALGAVTTWSFDPEDNITAVNHPMGARETFRYRNDSELTAQTDANGHTTRFDYDPGGNLSSITNPSGRTHTFAFDPLERIIKETGFDNQTTGYTYDAMDNITRIDKADGSCITIDYSLTNKPVTVTAISPTGTNTTNTYEWDAADRLVTAANENFRVTFAYDSLGRVIRETQNNFVHTHTLDPAGNRVSSSNSWGYDTQWEYDINNRPIRLTLPDNRQITITRDAAGRPIKRTLPGNVTSVCTHDPTGNLLSQAVTRTTDAGPEPPWNSPTRREPLSGPPGTTHSADALKIPNQPWRTTSGSPASTRTGKPVYITTCSGIIILRPGGISRRILSDISVTITTSTGTA